MCIITFQPITNLAGQSKKNFKAIILSFIVSVVTAVMICRAV